jgi:hypothetical protein
MCGMPFHRTYFWLRTHTAGLNEDQEKEQNEFYPVSLHRMFPLLLHCICYLLDQLHTWLYKFRVIAVSVNITTGELGDGGRWDFY